MHDYMRISLEFISNNTNNAERGAKKEILLFCPLLFENGKEGRFKRIKAATRSESLSEYRVNNKRSSCNMSEIDSILMSEDLAFISASSLAEALKVQELQESIIFVTQNSISHSLQNIMGSAFINSESGIQTIADTFYIVAAVRPRMLKTIVNLLEQLLNNISPNNKLDRLVPVMLTFDFNYMNENWHMAFLFECAYQHIIPELVISERIQEFADLYPAKGFEIWILLTWFGPIVENNNKEIFEDQSNRIVDFFKDGPNKFQYYLDLYQESRKNNWENFWEYIRTLYFPKSLGALIHQDDIDAFQQMATAPNFGIDQIINHTVYEFCPALWYHPHLLHFAAYHGAMEIFHYLLSRGASVETLDDNGNNLMQFAVAGGNTDIINICEQKGCSYDRAANTAVENFRNDIFHWLIGTELIKLDDSIFHSASASNNMHVMLYCIENGLKPEAKNKDGQNNLHITAIKGHCEAINLLLGYKGIDVNARDSNGLTPFLLSVQANRQKATEIFLKTPGVDLHAISDIGKNALHYAVEEGHPNLVKLLIDTDLYDINAIDLEGNTCMHLAALEDLSNCIELLIKHPNTDMNAPNFEGDTPLIIAIRSQQPNLAHKIIEDPRTDINKPIKESNIAPIHVAVSTGMNRILELLLQNPKIDVNAIDEEGNTPLHVAIPLSRIDAIKLLLMHPNVNINAQDHMGLTPLHACVNDDEFDSCELILQYPEIDVNIQDENGDTPLHFAVQDNESRCLNLLINFPNIDLSIKNKSGKTPIDYLKKDQEACQKIVEQFPDIAKFL